MYSKEEIKLSNDSTLNRQNLETAIRASMKTPVFYAMQVVYLILFLCLTVLLFVMIALKVRSSAITASIFMLVTIVALFIFTRWIFPKLSAKSQMRRKQELAGVEEIRSRMTFADDVLQICTEKPVEKIDLSYDKLNSISETEHLILLNTRERQIFILDKKGFQNGTQEDFWSLIAQKCPQAKIKRL